MTKAPDWDPETDAMVNKAAEGYAGLNTLMGPRSPKLGPAGDTSEMDMTAAESPHDRAVQAMAIIALQNKPEFLFVNGGGLARLIINEHSTALLDPLTENKKTAQVSAVLARSVQFFRYSKDGVKDYLHKPPPEVVDNFRTLGEWSLLPPIQGIVESPVIRRDGTVSQTPGYDALTQLYYHPPDPTFRVEVPDHPTRQQATDALHLILNEVLVDFPFKSRADRANAVGFMLTPLLRPTTGLAPMGIITAPKKGAGKGKLVTVASLIANGRTPSMYAHPGNSTELRKALDSMLLEGQTFIWIDEPQGILNDQALTAMLTSEQPQVRILGASTSKRTSQRATWVVTGNNVRVGGDMDRRSYRIVIDPQSSQPWMRDEQTFKHPDLEAHIREHRALYLGALLTMARAWWVANRPACKPVALGSYNEWAKTIGGVLEYAGCAGFLENLKEHYAESAVEADEWEAFLNAIYLTTGGQHFTVARLSETIDGHGDLRALLPEDLVEHYKTKSFSKVLGQALLTRKDTRHGVDEIHVVAAGKDRNKVRRWAVNKPDSTDLQVVA